MKRHVTEPKVTIDRTAVERARNERLRSERRLQEALPLGDVIRRMHHENHVSRYLDALVEKRTSGGSNQ